MNANLSQYFPALTGVRAIAAWMVFAHHFNPFSAPVLYNLTYVMHTGVSVFFVLSGFLIWHRYHSMVKTGMQWKKYLLHRFAKVFPLFFIVTTITFMFAGSFSNGADVYILNIVLLKGYFDDLKFSGIAQGWTLTVEETFYLLAPFLILVPRSKIVVVIAAFLLAGILLVALINAIQFDLYGFMRSNELMMTYTFFGRCTEFMTGIFLGMAINTNMLGRFSSGRRITAIGFIGVSAVIVVMSFFTNLWAGVMINNFMLPIAIAVLFYGLITESTRLSAFLASKPMQVFGKSSYAFYLVHVGIFQVWLSELGVNTIGLFVILNVLAIGLYYSIERPLQRMITSGSTTFRSS